jgi:xanthine dehydrogenase molybdopterin-binding subunit B
MKTSPKHDSGPLHVTGAARYTDDIPVPANTVHLAFGLSTIACGTITSIDLTTTSLPLLMMSHCWQKAPFITLANPSFLL